jgi:hypothetical protein
MRYDTPPHITQFTGYVVLPDALNYPQLIAWQDAIDDMLATSKSDSLTWDAATANPRTAQYIVTALCSIVREWRLTGLPERMTIDTFPATPRVQSVLLIAWLGGLVAGLFSGSEETPEKKAA